MAFFSTTVDDFAVILIFFAREYVKTSDIYDKDTQLALLNISLGQLIGFTVIVGVSLAIGIGLGSVVDSEYLSLIGFLPILIGLYKVYELGEEAGYLPPCHCCPAWCCCCTPPLEDEEKPDGEVGDGDAAVSAKDKVDLEKAGKTLDNALSTDSGKLLKSEGEKAKEEAKSLLDKDGKPAGEGATTTSEPTDAETGKVNGGTKRFRRKSSIGSLFSAPSRRGSNMRASLVSNGDEEEGTKPKEEGQIGAVLSDEALDQIESVDHDNCCVQFLKQYFFCCFSPLTMEVGLYALLFGTDNIAIYVALFCAISIEETVAIIVIFYGALLIYLGLAIFIIVQCPPVGKCIGDYAKYLVPVLLIGLGLYILHDSVAWVIPDPE